MSDVVFTHPQIGRSLTVNTGANQIEWGYGLNTQRYPTYGGEVVQILSAYADVLTIQGDLQDYSKMEEVYKWFLEYMQKASQGVLGVRYTEDPVTLSYPERGWILKIQPTALPGFRYATEVVAPSYQIQAYVVEQDNDMAQFTLQTVLTDGFDFNLVNAGMGFDDANPFSDPAAANAQYDPVENLNQIGDFYQNLIPSYLKDGTDFTVSSTPFSQPANNSSNSGVSKGQKTQQQGKNPKGKGKTKGGTHKNGR
jgi:hypothetical protein